MRDDDRDRRAGRRPTNGHRPHQLRTGATPLRAVEDPVDLVAVQADDELINALAAGARVSAPGMRGFGADDHVAAILASWRDEVDEEPIPDLVDLDTAIATIRSAQRPRSRARHLAPVAAAAAFVVFAMGGVSVGSASAQPGDALWGVSKVLFAERADSIEAADRVETRINSAKAALTRGESLLAAQELAQAQADLAAIRPEEGQAQLAEVQNFLVAKAEETPPGTPTDPGEPLQKDRQRRVPAGAAVGADPTTAPAQPSGGASPSATPGGGGGSADPGPGRDPSTATDPSAPGTAPSPSADPSPSNAGEPSPSATPEGGPITSTPPAPGQSMGNATPDASESAARTS